MLRFPCHDIIYRANSRVCNYGFFGDVVYYGGFNEYIIEKDIIAKDASMIEFFDLVSVKRRTWVGKYILFTHGSQGKRWSRFD